MLDDIHCVACRSANESLVRKLEERSLCSSHRGQKGVHLFKLTKAKAIYFILVTRKNSVKPSSKGKGTVLIALTAVHAKAIPMWLVDVRINDN